MNHHRGSITVLRSTLTRRRAQRADHRRLEHELASYRTPAERLELNTILSRHTADETRPIEGMLHSS